MYTNNKEDYMRMKQNMYDERPMASYAPIVIEREGNGERAFDLPSRLLKDRIVMLNSDVNNQSANSIIMQLLVLSAEDPEADIYFYINSPGGSVTDGLALFDTMNAIPNDIVTICMGSAASMGSFLLSGGTPGKRLALPNARLMYHQVMSGIAGGTQYVDMVTSVNETEKLYEKLNKYLSEFTQGNITYDDMKNKTDRDWWLSPEEAIEQGFIDKVLTKLGDV
jgi:ATP-dependent Clp protease, protease subunit